MGKTSAEDSPSTSKKGEVKKFKAAATPEFVITEEQKAAPEQEDKVGLNIAKSFAYEAGFRDGLGGFSGRDISTEEQRKRGEWLIERCKYYPIRLTLGERKMMRLVSNALDVSQYTDKVDVVSWSSKTGRIQAQLKELCAILCGLVLACDYTEGQKLLKDKDFEANSDFFQTAFEIARRHKIRNPEKLREVYGKMVHVLMDSQQPQILELMGFALVRPLQTVHSFLAENDCLDILVNDYGLIMDATLEIDPEGKSRSELDRELRARDAAFKALMRKYVGHTPAMNEETLENVFRSIGDNHNFLRWNRDPVDRMILNLQKYFHPNTVDPRFDLSIRFGQDGARLSHTHEVQYHYCLQSMTLWREILNEMFQLWYLAELDLFDSENSYRLKDTGQGLNRVQDCPRVARAMRTIIHRVHERVGSWVGSSVVHLGDRAVPNALMFVDKYNQVADILNPIDNTIRRLDVLLEETPSLMPWVKETFGSIHEAKLEILADFFRHGFDGSGADNFYDAGSCIDGRLTSAWNWCQKLSKKKYYPLFLLAGFVSFNGNW